MVKTNAIMITNSKIPGFLQRIIVKPPQKRRYAWNDVLLSVSLFSIIKLIIKKIYNLFKRAFTSPVISDFADIILPVPLLKVNEHIIFI